MSIYYLPHVRIILNINDMKQLIITTLLLLTSVFMNAQKLDGSADFKLQLDIAQTVDNDGKEGELLNVKSSVTFVSNNDPDNPKKGTFVIYVGSSNFTIDVTNVQIKKSKETTFYIAVTEEAILTWTSFSFELQRLTSKDTVRLLNSVGLQQAFKE